MVMSVAKAKPITVDEYINTAPKEAQKKLREMRAILKKVAPKANEGLKWGYPVFEEKRILFSYAANHLNRFFVRIKTDAGITFFNGTHPIGCIAGNVGNLLWNHLLMRLCFLKRVYGRFVIPDKVSQTF